MTRDDADRRSRRRVSQQLFDALVADYPALPDVTRHLMFGSEGLRYEGSLFAFIGGQGQLIVKVPADHAQRLVESGEADRVKVGRNMTREWIGVPRPDADDAGTWRSLIDDAHRYAVSLRSSGT